mgnify:FL=1
MKSKRKNIYLAKIYYFTRKVSVKKGRTYISPHKIPNIYETTTTHDNVKDANNDEHLLRRLEVRSGNAKKNVKVEIDKLDVIKQIGKTNYCVEEDT